MCGWVKVKRRVCEVGQVSLEHASEDGSEAVAVQVAERFCVGDDGPVGAGNEHLHTGTGTDGMHGVDDAEYVGIRHAEAKCAVATDIVAEETARIARGESAEVDVDVGHEVADVKVLPVAGDGRVDVPGAAEGRPHVHGDENEFADLIGGNGAVEDLGGVVLIEDIVMTAKGVRQKVDDWITLRGGIVSGRQIDGELARGIDSDEIVGEILRVNFAVHESAGVCGEGPSGDEKEKSEDESK